MHSSELIEITDKHLRDLKSTRNKRSRTILLLTLCSILFGATLSFLYLQKGDSLRSMVVLLPFDLIFPFALLRFGGLFAGPKYSLAQELVNTSKPTQVTVESLDVSNRIVRLRLPDSRQNEYVIDDPSFGFFNILESNLTQDNGSDKSPRIGANSAFTGEVGYLYTVSPGNPAILFMSNKAIAIEPRTD